MQRSIVSSEDDWLNCHRCGQLLGNDPDDEPDGGVDGLPMCGECARNRDESADFDESGLGEGEIDRVSDDF
mgnify:CR=1 FL=1